MRILLLFTICFSIQLMAQDSLKIQSDTTSIPNFMEVEELAEFPGGEAALMQFIHMRVEYPVIDRENGIQGTVYAEFEIDTAGYVRNPKIARGVSPTMDNAVLRVVKRLPKFKPARHKGRVVRVRYRLPVNFRLG